MPNPPQPTQPAPKPPAPPKPNPNPLDPSNTQPSTGRVVMDAPQTNDPNRFDSFTFDGIPADKAFQITDYYLFNPFGDVALVQILVNDTILAGPIAASGYRIQDEHNIQPWVFNAGQRLVVQIQCVKPGPGRTTCSETLSFNGQRQK